MNDMKHVGTREASQSTLRPIDPVKKGSFPMKKDAVVILVVYAILMSLGVGTGYVLSQKGGGIISTASKGEKIETEKVVGVKDASTFKDCATGTLEAGGFEGEGTHKLVRDGGPSQTAYLISSVVDLDGYVKKKVNVCGQTMAAKNVSWLMDVGRLEILE